MNDVTTEKKTVLIVDDEENLVHILARKFEDEGITAYTAFNGREGLTLAREKRPEIMLLDVVMPEMDGFEVLRALKEDKELSDMPVILLTNSSSIETVAQAVTSGMNEFLVKTEIGLDEVVRHVKQRLGALR